MKSPLDCWVHRGKQYHCHTNTVAISPCHLASTSWYVTQLLAIYAPMINTAPCIMFWMCAYPLQGQVGGGWALEIVKWHRADRRVLFGAQKTRDFQGPTPSHLPKYWICTHSKHNARGCIHHRCICGFMYKSPRGRFQGPYCGGWGSRCIKELNCPAWAAQVHKGT